MIVSEKIAALPQLESIIRQKEHIFDVAIIGGGPAGLTAGLYAGRAGLKAILIEKALLGGQISLCQTIENYPGFPAGISGLELASRLEDHAKKFGVEIVWGEVIGISIEGALKKVNLADKTFSARTVIVATGTEPKKLNVPGEEEFRGRGVSYCATCDGAFYKDKDIVVVGGGNSAISEALFLARFAFRLVVVHRRAALRADKILVDRAAADPKINFVWNNVVEKIVGSDKVREVEIRNVLDNKNGKIRADGVFIYIGENPSVSIVRDLVDTSEEGFVIVESQMKTSRDGIFAAGDVCKKHLRQIATAVGDGATAADSARKYLENML